MHRHNCRCFQQHLWMLLQCLRALCFAPGGVGSIWKYSKALVRATGVSQRCAYRFRTDLHLPDEIAVSVKSPILVWVDHTMIGDFTDILIGLLLPPKTRHLNLTTLAPIQYLSADCIVTWSVHRMCIIRHSLISWFQNCDATNIGCVAIENPRISHQIWHYFTATQRISIALQFRIREVKELLQLHNLRTDHVIIRSELKNLIGAKELPKW
jgi:hypothetical protein